MSLMRVAVLSWLALLSMGLPASAQPPLRGGSALPDESAFTRKGLTRRWWAHAVMNAQRDKLNSISVDETTLFLQSSSGEMTAFDAQTGQQLWARAIGPRDRAIFPPALNDEMLFVIGGMRLFAVRKTNGDIVWDLPLPSPPSSSPAVDEQRAFIGFLDGSMYAFDLKVAAKLYTEGRLPQYAVETILWRYPTTQPITIPAVVDGQYLAFASRNGSLYSVTASERKLVFQFQTDARVSAPLVRYKKHVLLASEDSNLYSISMRNGASTWQFTTGFVIRKAPVLIDDEIYLLPDRGNLYKLSAVTGEPLWPRPQTGFQTFLSASANRIYAVDGNNDLQIVSRETGQRLGSLPLGRFKVTVTNDRSDRIYLATESGLLMCLHEIGRDYPRFHLHPERQPLLPDFAPDNYDADAPADQPAADEK